MTENKGNNGDRVHFYSYRVYIMCIECVLYVMFPDYIIILQSESNVT